MNSAVDPNIYFYLVADFKVKRWASQRHIQIEINYSDRDVTCDFQLFPNY